MNNPLITLIRGIVTMSKTLISVDWLKKVVCVKETGKADRHHCPVAVTLGGITFRGINIMFQLPNDSTANIVLAPQSAKGKAEAVENVTYVSSDEAILTVDASGLVTPVANGVATVTITADADLTSGIQNLVEPIEIAVIEPQAVALNPSLVVN
jgi:hypothetical protein